MGLVKQEGDFRVVKVHEPVLFMHCVTPEIIAQKHVPILSVVSVEVLFQVLCDLNLSNQLL